MSFLEANLLIVLACIEPFHGVLRIKPQLISMDHKTLRIRHLQGIWHLLPQPSFPPHLPRLSLPHLSFLKDLGALFILTRKSSTTLPASPWFNCHSPTQTLLRGAQLAVPRAYLSRSPVHATYDNVFAFLSPPQDPQLQESHLSFPVFKHPSPTAGRHLNLPYLMLVVHNLTNVIIF